MLVLIDHPLVIEKLTRLRDKRTNCLEFRRLLGEISLLMAYEIARDFKTIPVKVETPLGVSAGVRMEREVVLVPILRAGLGMLESILKIMPEARIGFLGLRRDEETLQPHHYYSNIPSDLSQAEVILIDPMLATGGSVDSAMGMLSANKAANVRLLSLVAAPEGIRLVTERYPELPIYTAAVDERLNEKGYILPGLGDAGDRLFGV